MRMRLLSSAQIVKKLKLRKVLKMAQCHTGGDSRARVQAMPPHPPTPTPHSQGQLSGALLNTLERATYSAPGDIL